MKTNLCKLFILAIVLFTAGKLNAQNTFPATGSAGIGTATPNASSILEVKSTTKGLLLPRMTTAQKSAIVTPVAGLLIYQTDNTKGLYHYTGSAWKAVAPAAWNLAGNGATTASQFLGTTDNKSLRIKTNNIQRAVIDSLGNMGIGTTSPIAKVHVASGLNQGILVGGGNLTGPEVKFMYDNATHFSIYNDGSNKLTIANTSVLSYTNTPGTILMSITNVGNVGIGTTNPQSLLHISGEIRWGGSGNAPYVFSNIGPDGAFIEQVGNSVANSKLRLQSSRNGDVVNYSQFYIDPVNGFTFRSNGTANGNVGIGTITPAYKLDVCGVIRANEVRVEIGWCDYVFADDYKLPALSEVEAFIKENKHLPDVTKGSIIETEGLEVGKTSAQMIRKIEELTLYVIDLQKQVDELKKNK